MVARFFSSLLFIAASFLILIFSGTKVFSEDGSEQPGYIKFIFGPALDEEKQAFESHIAALTSISLDDISRKRSVLKIDMEGRKKFFSDQGWREYLEFVASQKSLLSSIKSQYEHPQAFGRFVTGTQIYQKVGMGHTFKATIGFCYLYWDVRDCEKESHSLEVSVEGAFEKPTEMIIHSWRVQTLEAK